MREVSKAKMKDAGDHDGGGGREDDDDDDDDDDEAGKVFLENG